MKRTVYMVQYDWLIDDGEQDSVVWLYERYEDAEQKFKAIIESEKDPDLYFGEAFDENGEMTNENYTLEQHDHENGNKYWCIYPNCAYGTAHSTVILAIKEVL